MMRSWYKQKQARAWDGTAGDINGIAIQPQVGKRMMTSDGQLTDLGTLEEARSRQKDGLRTQSLI